MTEPVRLQTTFIPNEGEFFRVKLALDIAIEEVQREPGCLQYEITEESEERIVLSEEWASEEDLDRHTKGTALQDLNESLSALLAEPVRFERVSPDDPPWRTPATTHEAAAPRWGERRRRRWPAARRPPRARPVSSSGPWPVPRRPCGGRPPCRGP